MPEAAEEELVKEANAAVVVLEVAATSPLVRDFDRHEAARRADLFRRLVAALSRAEAERGAFPEEHAYMALLRLPIATSVLRASPEIQAAMATCVRWLAAYLNQEPQYVQEYYEARVAAEACLSSASRMEETK